MNIVAVRKRKDCTEKRSEKINSKRARRIRGWHLKKRPVQRSLEDSRRNFSLMVMKWIGFFIFNHTKQRLYKLMIFFLTPILLYFNTMIPRLCSE